MQQVSILGLGLIGVSIGLGLKKWASAQKGGPPLAITGYDHDLNRQRQAKSMAAIDTEARDLPSAVRTADLVILAVPIGVIEEVMTDCAPHLHTGATVTDVASVKAPVLEAARRLLPITVSFIGGHPMAGGTGSIDAARADLFAGARWCLTPSVRANETAIETVLGLVAALGAERYFVDAAEHDGLVAAVSHLPFSVAAALVRAVTADPAWREMRLLAAGGFRDTTRVAEGSPTMHRDIALANADALTRWLDRMVEEMTALRGLIASSDGAALLTYFEATQDARIRWRIDRERQTEAAGPAVDAPDIPTLGESMQQMFFGNLGRRRRPPRDDGRGQS
ncbi:MAG: prephenate dehydrogenase [Chloroflexi bacterium]|nr:prephenate dehydrogenase [Chloroflexota bacterium]